MKSFKLIIIFSILAFAIVGALWALNIIPAEVASDYAGKLLMVVLILGGASMAIGKVAGSGTKSSDANGGGSATGSSGGGINEGPKF